MVSVMKVKSQMFKLKTFYLTHQLELILRDILHLLMLIIPMVIYNQIVIHTGVLKKLKLLMNGSEMFKRNVLSSSKEVHSLVWVNLDLVGQVITLQLSLKWDTQLLVLCSCICSVSSLLELTFVDLAVIQQPSFVPDGTWLELSILSQEIIMLLDLLLKSPGSSWASMSLVLDSLTLCNRVFKLNIV